MLRPGTCNRDLFDQADLDNIAPRRLVEIVLFAVLGLGGIVGPLYMHLLFEHDCHAVVT